MISKVQLDIENYMGVFVDHNELDAKMGDLIYPEGYPVADEWIMPKGELYDATGRERTALQEADIASWVGNMTFSPEAYRKVGKALSPYGEFLPISINGEIWHAFNTLKFIEHDGIDIESSERMMSGGIYMGVTKISFKEEHISPSIFRTNFDEGADVYFKDELYTLFENEKLKGLKA